MTCKVGRFWNKHPKDRRKWASDSPFNSIPRSTRGNLQRSLRPRKYVDAKGKIRQKLINGIYDSFCYNSRHGIDLYPATENQTFGPSTTNVTIHRESLQNDINMENKDFTSITTNIAQPAEQFLPCPHTWRRTYSWSSRHSAMTSFTSSSGYSSLPASCPSSANSHRSSSPTPDFTNIRSLTATLERCSLEEDLELDEREEEFCWEKTLPTITYPGTWPLSRKATPSHRETKRIFSGDGIVFNCILFDFNLIPSGLCFSFWFSV